MTPRPRPTYSKSRPLSAIYIGPGSTHTSSPPSVPDLPEPPSPSSSNASGLPSPPATNSTGSDSVGDRNSTSAGSLRQLSGSRTNLTSDMSNGIHEKPYRASKNRQAYTDDEDDSNDQENEEDHTAKLSNGRRAPNDNMSALQRVKNLTQRNRMVLDKLSSISRLSSPAPSTKSRSSMSPPSAGSSSSSSRVTLNHPRPQSASNPLPVNGNRLDTSHSGSETERESQRISQHSYSSSDDLSATPPSAYRDFRAPPPLRERRISAPASPAKNGRPYRDRDRGPSPGPSRTPKKRTSVARSVDEGSSAARQEDESDITAAALAAVASSRRSPTGSSSKRNRQPLPREFREKDRRSLDGKTNGEPSTPHRHPHRNSPPSPEASRTNPSNTQTSPRRPGSARYSTVRELTRKHQTRWLSEDLSTSGDGDPEDEIHMSNGSGGRRQSHRGGSSDGYLVPMSGRSLVSEGLRAAGITRRRDVGDDPFANGVSVSESPRRTKSTGNSTVAHSDWDLSSTQYRGSRVSEGVGPTSSSRSELRNPSNSQRNTDHVAQIAGALPRPGTSMAALHHESSDIPAPRAMPSALRPHKSSHNLMDRDRVISPRARGEIADQTPDRSYSSPYAVYRSSSTAPLASGTSPGLGRDTNAEHRRLMLESLGVFESHLSRLPPMGSTTTSTIPELFQNGQHLVHALDRLNGILKAGTNKALEAQIDAEVSDTGDGVDVVDIWRAIGAEYRESLRVSDEVVRNMTGFLLGMGKVLRDSSALHGQQHLRTMSLNEEVTRKLTPEVTPTTSSGRGSDGRKSRETRRSWDPREMGESTTRLASIERSHIRPGSSFTRVRGSATSSSEGRSVADAVGEQTPQTVRNVSQLASSSSIRRLYITREQRATPDALPPIKTSLEYQGSPGNYEPSPTPTSRTSQQSALSERHRAFPPLAIAPSLPTLPSESLLSRSSTDTPENTARRKVSNNSNVTVRAEPTAFTSVIKPANTTTALTTHTVSMLNSPAELERPSSSPHPLYRTESSGSGRTNGVTFSRPPTVSVSALSGLQQRDPERLRRPSRSAIEDEPRVQLSLAPAAAISPMSGSETERPESWRRTIGSRPRIATLDGPRETDPVEAMRSNSRLATMSGVRKERRRTITEVFQR